MTSLLIHVAGGRPEMHYAIFASLPFLAMYRDISVLLLASSDHRRSITCSAASCGRSRCTASRSVSPWAWVTDVWLLAVEDMLLALAIRKSRPTC